MKTSPAQAIPVSCVCTVFNERQTVGQLIESLTKQKTLPSEMVIVDGGSTDGTWAHLQELAKQQWPFMLKCIQKKGNRSVGRNIAIASAHHETICITDAGCIPNRDWISELLAARQQSEQSVIAGYYKGRSNNPFEQAVIPYALVMPDSVNSDTFLPATRSMLIQRTLWKQMGGFDESLSDNEDYAFARRLQQKNIPIGFAPRAVVVWQPRSTLRSFWTMIFRFARGDAKAGLWRPKVALIFARYIFLVGLTIWMIVENMLALLAITLSICATLYVYWAIQKNIRHVSQGWYWLPVLQITADGAVMSGTVSGILQKRATAWRSKD